MEFILDVWGSNPVREKIYFFFLTSRPSVGSRSLLSNGYERFMFRGQSTWDTKKITRLFLVLRSRMVGLYQPCDFMARCLIVYKDKFFLPLCRKVHVRVLSVTNKQTNKLHGLSPRANCTDRATVACRRSDCQLLRIKGATWSA
jgi:hypothetical protein